MKIFISWSGAKSKAVGELLDNWIQCVLQAVEPWISTEDIDKGSLWFSEITNQLKDTSLGIICLTQTNKEKPWILFEAGALYKGLPANRVYTFLIDLESKDICNPLSQFNHTLPTREDVFRLMKTLNNLLEDRALREKTLENVFDTYWPQFESAFNEIAKVDYGEDRPVISRSDNDILSEILETTRGFDRRIRNIENKDRDIIPFDIVSSVQSLDNLEQFIDKALGNGIDEKRIILAARNLYPRMSKLDIAKKMAKCRLQRNSNENQVYLINK